MPRNLSVIVRLDLTIQDPLIKLDSPVKPGNDVKDFSR
jgi:hypothetical protein